MRVLSLSPFFESHGGGVEIVAGALARALRDEGVASAWCATGPAPLVDGVETVSLAAFDPIERATGLPMPVPAPNAVARLWREVARADIVVAHEALYASTLAARAAAWRFGKPFVLVQHIGVLSFENAALRLAMALADRLAARPLLARADQVVFISETVREYFATTQKRRPSRLIHNGVDAALFRPPEDADEKASLRRTFGLPEGPLVAFAGRFVAKKGLGVIQALARRLPEHRFALAGAGPIDPGAWNLPNVALVGRLERRRMADLFRAADALVLPSLGEGFPLVVQEAMASGLAVYCGSESARADRGAQAFLAGIDVDLADPDGTAGRFARAIRETPPRPRPDAARYARQAYDWNANARVILEIARELVDARAAPRGASVGGRLMSR